MTTTKSIDTTNISRNNLKCLLCQADVKTNDYGRGLSCQNDNCRTYYLNSGFIEIESLLESKQAHRNPPVVQDSNHGCLWFYCQHHDEYERDSAFDNSPCVRKLYDMTPLLSG